MRSRIKVRMAVRRGVRVVMEYICTPVGNF
jgi:hypothetical protein